jgi:hypothetical protein
MRVKLFWSKFDNETSYNEWVNKEIELTPLHKLSLASHRRGTVDLYSYQNIKDLPKYVNLIDAHEILSKKAAIMALRRGHSIAHISDYVRMRAACLDGGGIVMDMDTIRLRPLPEDGFLASIPAKMSGGFAPKWGDAHPPLTVIDKSWDGKALSNFPVGINAEMIPHIQMITYKILEALSKPPGKDSKAWNFVMWSLKEIPKEVPVLVYPPLAFGPLPAWLGPGKCYSIESPTRLDGETELFGYRLPSIEDIMGKSYAVQNFFESAFQSAGDKLDLWNTISDDCLLAIIAGDILGEDWREKLGGKKKKSGQLF